MVEKNPFYEINTWYSIIINPENRYQHLGSPNRYRNFIRWLKAELHEVFEISGIHYVGNAELSEPRNMTESVGPRLHFHGMFRFRTTDQIYLFLLLGMNRLARMGHVDLDTVGDPADWIRYCRKHSLVMPKDATLSNHYSLEDQYLQGNVLDYEAPGGLPQGRGPVGLAEGAQADVSVGSEAPAATKPIRRIRSKPVSIATWVAPPNNK